MSVACDFIAQWRRTAVLATVAYYNLTVAAIPSLPVVVTGLMAWRWDLKARELKGTLLLHLLLGLASAALIWLVWWVHFKGRKPEHALPLYRLPLEDGGGCGGGSHGSSRRVPERRKRWGIRGTWITSKLLSACMSTRAFQAGKVLEGE